MSPFFWRMMVMLSVLFLVFLVTTVALTLTLVTEVHNNDVNLSILAYVEVANWIYIGLIALAAIAAIFSTPYIISYTRRSESIVSTGLRQASTKNTNLNK